MWKFKENSTDNSGDFGKTFCEIQQKVQFETN